MRVLTAPFFAALLLATAFAATATAESKYRLCILLTPAEVAAMPARP